LVIGFVSRSEPDNTKNYNILAIEKYKPNTFASQISLQLDNMWGVVQDMINEITTVTENVENEDFLLLKMPNNSQINLYEIKNIESEESDEDE
jgi:hypothetical protein